VVQWLRSLTSCQKVQGSNPTVSVTVRLWVSLFASIASPHPGVKGAPSACLACSADLKLQRGPMLPRELSWSFERTGQWS
jgi:hypothetical protein